MGPRSGCSDFLLAYRTTMKALWDVWPVSATSNLKSCLSPTYLKDSYLGLLYTSFSAIRPFLKV